MSPTSGRRDPRAGVVLGAATGLGLPALVDGLLLPVVDEFPAHALCLAVGGLLLSAGWAGLSLRSRPISARAVRLLGLAMALLGCAASLALPVLNEQLSSVLAGGTRLPGSLLLAGFGLAALSLFVLPLGALLGLARDEQRGSLAAALLGLALGLFAAPWLIDVVLGAPAVVQVASVLAGAAALPLAERAPLVPLRLRHSSTALGSLLATGLVLGLLLHLLPGRISLGTALAPWLSAAVALGGALTLVLPGTLGGAGHAALALTGLPWLVGWSAHVPLEGAVPVEIQVAGLLLLGLLTGLLGLACLRAPSGSRGMPESVAPAALLLAAPVALVAVLPRAGAWGSTLTVAAVLLLCAGQRPSAKALALPLALGLLFAWIGGLLPQPALSPRSVVHLDRAQLALVTDPVTGEERLALDGHARIGSSRLQDRRLVHLPLLLQAGHAPGVPLRRTLVVSQDLGQAASAAAQHRPERLDWLSPLPTPFDVSPGTPQQIHRASGGERLHLLREQGEHDVIVLLPDPRGRRRAGLMATREAYALLASRLSPEGLFCQWWDLGQVDVTDLKAALGSALQACEEVFVLLDHPLARQGLLGIVGFRHRPALSPAAVDARLASLPEVSADMAAVGLDGFLISALPSQPTGVLALLTPRERGLSDRRPTLGLRGGLRPLPAPTTELLGMDTFASRRCDASAWIVAAPSEREAINAHARDLIEGFSHLAGSAQAVLASGPWPVLPFEQEHPDQANLLELAGSVEALASLPDWAWLRARVVAQAAGLERTGRHADAERALRSAVNLAQASADLRFALASTVERRGDLADACELYGTVLAFDAEHPGARAGLARCCAPR